MQQPAHYWTSLEVVPSGLTQHLLVVLSTHLTIAYSGSMEPAISLETQYSLVMVVQSIQQQIHYCISMELVILVLTLHKLVVVQSTH